MPESQLLIIVAVIVVASLIALKVYTYRKARYLRELGYSFVYYYMKSCGEINDFACKSMNKSRNCQIIPRKSFMMVTHIGPDPSCAPVLQITVKESALLRAPSL